MIAFTLGRYRRIACTLVVAASSVAAACGGEAPRGGGERTAIVRAALTTLSTCGSINAPGSYVLASDLSGASGACLAIANTTQVTLDCQGHTLNSPGGGVSVTNTAGYAVKNCLMPTGATVTSASGGSFTGNTLGRYVQTYASATVLSGNSLSTSTGPNVVSSTFGRGNVITGNTIDGGGSTGDGILLLDERDTTISGNTIRNTSNSGIQFEGTIASNVIANNTILLTTTGFTGWNWLSFLDNDVIGNTITAAAIPFEFARSCGLRPAGWNDLLGGPGLAVGDSTVYFHGNDFDRNKFTSPSAIGCGGIDLDDNGRLLDYDNSICNGGTIETRPSTSQFVLTSNAFSNEDFSAMECAPGPTLGEPAVPGAVIDRGNNACYPGTLTDYPLHCLSAVVPPPAPANVVDVVSATQTGGSAACNGSADGTGTGLAYSGSSVFASGAQQDWRYVLALLYGGLDLSTGVVDCGQASRQTLVSSWANLFQNGCANADGVCGDSAHGGALWHAFRLDDSSGASAVFAAALGLSPTPSAGAANGFGASPFCNAINWDATSANANCTMGAHNQWTGPGGVDDPASTTTPKHRRPPPGTWGDSPDPSQGALGADVLPTSFQDNDPIRRPCLGGATNAPLRSGEEVCNIEGTLGLVIPIPDSSFLATQTASLTQYPTNACNTFLFGKGPTVFTCAVRGSGTHHSGACPNGDALIAGGCLIPVDAIGGTSQCVATKATVPALESRSVGGADGRAYNVHMRDGTVVEPTMGYAQKQITGPSGTISLDFVGGYGRIHQVETVFTTGAVAPVPCHRSAATDQIGCLVQADPCSIAYAGDGARTDITGGADALRVAQTYATSGGYPLACPSGVSCQY
jgi:parallel beta-helix repeat protein